MTEALPFPAAFVLVAPPPSMAVIRASMASHLPLMFLMSVAMVEIFPSMATLLSKAVLSALNCHTLSAWDFSAPVGLASTSMLRIVFMSELVPAADDGMVLPVSDPSCVSWNS